MVGSFSRANRSIAQKNRVNRSKKMSEFPTLKKQYSKWFNRNSTKHISLRHVLFVSARHTLRANTQHLIRTLQFALISVKLLCIVPHTLSVINILVFFCSTQLFNLFKILRIIRTSVLFNQYIICIL